MALQTPVRVSAVTPMQLFSNVMEKVSQGFDICSPTFPSRDHSSLNVFMVKAQTLYEYYLIEADSLEELDIKIERLSKMDYDFMYGVVLYNGSYLQWMQRMYEPAREAPEPASVKESVFTLVEAAQPLGSAVPVRFGIWLEKLYAVRS